MTVAWDGVGRANRVRSTLAVDTPSALIVIPSNRADARSPPSEQVLPSSASWDVWSRIGVCGTPPQRPDRLSGGYQRAERA
jgi:hypothetical protein